MNTTMRNAAIKAITVDSPLQDKLIDVLRSGAGTNSRSMFTDLNPSAYPANQLHGRDVCVVRKQRVLCRLKHMVPA